MASQSGSKSATFKRGNYDFFDILRPPPVPEVVLDKNGGPVAPQSAPPPPGIPQRKVSLKSLDINLSKPGSKTFKRGKYDFHDILQPPPAPKVEEFDEYGRRYETLLEIQRARQSKRHSKDPEGSESPPPPGSLKSLKSCDIHLKKHEAWKKKKKKVKKIIPRWTSLEYKFATVDPTAPGFKAPNFLPPRLSVDEKYVSSHYQVDMAKKSDHPYEPQKGAYLSKEYQKDYPAAPVPYPDVPLGFTPVDGPWVKCFDSMWNPIWVTLKELDVTEAKKEDWTGFDWRKDHIA